MIAAALAIAGVALALYVAMVFADHARAKARRAAWLQSIGR
jgi:hypothetical protein